MNIMLKTLAAIALLAACPQAIAQAASATPSITPEASKAMRGIGEALRKLKGYSVETNVVTRAALGGGRYREFEGKVAYTIAPPNELFAHVRGKDLERQVYYDGNTITVVAPAQRKYAQVQAPGSIATFRQQLREARGLELPIADLFAWGANGGPVSAIDEGRYAGIDVIGGRECQHYTFSGEGIIWEVWADTNSLPCKVGMADSRDAGLPGYSAEITWTSTAGGKAVPRFAPPSGLAKVDLSELAETDLP